MTTTDADMMAVGKQCSVEECMQLDFLPFSCSGCGSIFCAEHRSAASHSCPKAGEEDVQVIVCPTCAKAIKLELGIDPNDSYQKHMESGQCDPTNYSKVHKKKKCSVKSCKEKLTTTNSITCKDCGADLCLKHRLGMDHGCDDRQAAAAAAATATPGKFRTTLGNFFGGGSSKKSAAPSAATAATATAAPSTTGAPAPETVALPEEEEKVVVADEKPPTKTSTPSRLASAKAKLSNAAKQATSTLTSQLSSRSKSKSKSATTAAAAQEGDELCTVCGATFLTVEELIDHAAVDHSDGWSSGAALAIRPVEGGIERCPHCTADFDDPVSLVQHVESVHADRVTQKQVVNGDDATEDIDLTTI